MFPATVVDEQSVDALIRSATLFRRTFDPSRDAGRPFVLSGRPDAWDDAEDWLAQHGCTVLAYHDIRQSVKERARRGRQVLRGTLGRAFESSDVLFAGAPNKHWFNSSPPALQRCHWHVAPPDWQLRGRHTPQLWDQHRAALVELFRSLADDESRRTLAALVRARLEGDMGYHRISSFTEYDHPVVRASPGDVVIDAGAYDGDTALLYGGRVGRRGRVIALEPSPENYAKLVQRIRRQSLSQVTPLLVGAHEDDAVLRFSDGKGASAKLDAAGTTQIVVTSIDKLVMDHRLPRVDLIKLDVEGAERAALEGARATLRRHRPIMHVSIYHKYDDLFELPALLRDWLPGYRFYLGHHSYYQMETDLYAIPAERWARGFVRRRVSRALARARTAVTRAGA